MEFTIESWFVYLEGKSKPHLNLSPDFRQFISVSEEDRNSISFCTIFSLNSCYLIKLATDNQQLFITS